MDGWDGLDLRVGGGIEHLTVLIILEGKLLHLLADFSASAKGE